MLVHSNPLYACIVNLKPDLFLSGLHGLDGTMMNPKWNDCGKLLVNFVSYLHEVA